MAEVRPLAPEHSTNGAAPRARLRIALFVPWITTGRGGTEAVGAMLANAMAERRHRVFVHTFDDTHSEPSFALHSDILLSHHAETPTDVGELQMTLEVSAQRPDVIVGLHLNREFFRYVALGARIEVPVLLSEHVDPVLPWSLGRFSPDERLMTFSGADRIHVLLDEFRAALPDYLAAKTVVIPNTVLAPDTLAKTDNTGPVGSILAVSRSVESAEIRVLIRAFALASSFFPEWTLKFRVDDPQMGMLREFAQRSGVADRVEVLAKSEQPYSLYEQAQIFALASDSLATLEAMAHGLPVVAFRDSVETRHLVSHSETGLLVDREQEEETLAAALIDLMGSPGTRKKMGDAGRQIFVRDFSPAIVFDKWEQLIGETAKTRRVAAQMDMQTLAAGTLARSLRAGCEAYFASPVTRF